MVATLVDTDWIVKSHGLVVYGVWWWHGSLQAPVGARLRFYGPTDLQVIMVPTAEADDFYNVRYGALPACLPSVTVVAVLCASLARSLASKQASIVCISWLTPGRAGWLPLPLHSFLWLAGTSGETTMSAELARETGVVVRTANSAHG